MRRFRANCPTCSGPYRVRRTTIARGLRYRTLFCKNCGQQSISPEKKEIFTVFFLVTEKGKPLVSRLPYHWIFQAVALMCLGLTPYEIKGILKKKTETIGTVNRWLLKWSGNEDFFRDLHVEMQRFERSHPWDWRLRALFHRLQPAQFSGVLGPFYLSVEKLINELQSEEESLTFQIKYRIGELQKEATKLTKAALEADDFVREFAKNHLELVSKIAGKQVILRQGKSFHPK